jgi:hypothetical protein
MKHKLKGKKQTKEHIKKRVESCKRHPRKLRDLETKLLKKIKIDKNGCWIWIGAIFYKLSGSYGQIRIGRKKDNKLLRAHRVSYEHFIGKIPKGKELDHLCRNTLCINPKHLEAVSHLVNMKRRKDSGLPYCRHGHKYTKETTYIRPDNRRRECKICRKLRIKKFKKNL